MQLTSVKPATSDARGDISDILYKTDIQHAAVINTVAGNIVRGNHYHSQTTQYMFITKGSLWYWYKQINESDAKFIRACEFDLIETPPFEIHALHILEPTQFIVFTNGTRGGIDYESDTIRVNPILTSNIDMSIYAE